jgi:hypothetical protein
METAGDRLPPTQQFLGYAADDRPPTEPRLDVWQGGAALVLPPPPRWVGVFFVAAFSALLAAVLRIDLLLYTEVLRNRSLDWYVGPLCVLGPLTVGFGTTLVYAVLWCLRLKRFVRRLEASVDGLLLVTPGVWRASRREWSSGRIQRLTVTRRARRRLDGRYVFQLQVPRVLRMDVFSRDAEFGQQVAAAFQAALRLNDDRPA